MLPGGVQAWGHNEDGEPALGASTTTYFVAANITYPNGEFPDSSYFAFTYPGQLSGWAWGFNAHGVSQSINALWDNQPDGEHMLGVTFISRNVLDASDMQDALKRTRIPYQGGGMHFNLGSATAACTVNDPCQYSVESSPDGTSALNLHTVPGGRYAHFNQYLHSDQPPLGDYESSVHRLARAAALNTRASPPQTTDQMLAVLSDQTDKQYPIHRANTTEDPMVTYTTSLFDLRAKTLQIFTQRAVDSDYNTAPQPRSADITLSLLRPLDWPL